MILADVNVLVRAHREDIPEHRDYRRWLEDVLNGDEAFGVSDLVLSVFLRIVTHPRIFPAPTPLGDAVDFANTLRDQPQAVRIEPGERHWDIFTRLCKDVAAKGNLIPDAYYAALAIESGCEWVTSDRDYSRFKELRWRHPLETSRGR